MPAIIHLAANLIFGSCFVLVTRKSAALRTSSLSWPLLALAAFEALVFTPIATYQFRFYPQWSMLYSFDPQMFPQLHHWIGPLSLAVILLNFSAAAGAFLLARRGILADSPSLWLAPIAVGAGAILYVGVFFGERIAFVGDYDQFWQGQAQLLLSSFTGWLGIALYVSGLALLLFVHSRFSDHDPQFF